MSDPKKTISETRKKIQELCHFLEMAECQIDDEHLQDENDRLRTEVGLLRERNPLADRNEADAYRELLNMARSFGYRDPWHAVVGAESLRQTLATKMAVIESLEEEVGSLKEEVSRLKRKASEPDSKTITHRTAKFDTGPVEKLVWDYRTTIEDTRYGDLTAIYRKGSTKLWITGGPV